MHFAETQCCLVQPHTCLWSTGAAGLFSLLTGSLRPGRGCGWAAALAAAASRSDTAMDGQHLNINKCLSHASTVVFLQQSQRGGETHERKPNSYFFFFGVMWDGKQRQDASPPHLMYCIYMVLEYTFKNYIKIIYKINNNKTIRFKRLVIYYYYIIMYNMLVSVFSVM